MVTVEPLFAVPVTALHEAVPDQDSVMLAHGAGGGGGGGGGGGDLGVQLDV
jgi:hypothetical protein